MKKSLLLLIVMLMSTGFAGAVDWLYVETNIPDLELFLDKDSIRCVDDSCFYAIRYRYPQKFARAAYLKSDFANNHIGVIRAEDFEEEKYLPHVVFTADPHAFMKPVESDSLLEFAHNFTNNLIAENRDEYNFVPVAYTKFLETSDLTQFTNTMETNLYKNWQPTKLWRKTSAEVLITIGKDGSLQNYRITKTSGSDKANRAIISAIEKTVPFGKYSKNKKDVINLKFRFENDKCIKSVKYVK